MQEVKIELEQPADFEAVEILTREAFWNQHVPGCDEHYLIHLIRQDASFLPELDFVARFEGQLVGNIVYTKAQIQRDDGGTQEVITFGPLSVLPAFQGKGVGKQLIEHSQKAAKTLGYSAILIYGDPAYYVKRGFVPAERYHIGTRGDTYADALLAYELVEGALRESAGQFHEAPVYDINVSLAEEFDQNFNFKEKRNSLPSQLKFLEMVKKNKPREKKERSRP